MAFVWEACCRLNGRLTVSEGGVDLPPIPPGPAAAHAFAKPAIILPGKENDFESMLVDWVFIKRTGRYQIRGHYVGVLPEQKPPYPRSVELWRGEADTGPIEVELITVQDYLAQRGRRAAQSGIDAHVSGPAQLPPVGAVTLAVRIRNSGREPLTLQWPLDADLWIVDAAGLRVQRKPVKPTGDDQAVVIPSGGEWTQGFPVSATDLNGGPFGEYRVFVDFPAKGGRLRTPSQPHPLHWEIDSVAAAALMNDAAAGSTSNPRNLPLRVLRQYLALLEPVLSNVTESSLSAAAAPLRGQLRLAACLRELPVQTGRATLRIAAEPGGHWRFSEPLVLRCATGEPLEQLQAVAAVRRHLNLEFATRLQPTDVTTAGDLQAVSAILQTAAPDFAAPPRFIANAPANTIAGSVTFPAAPPPANLVLRLTRRGDRVIAAVDRKLAESPGQPSLVPAGDLMTMDFQPVAAVADLDTLLADGKLPAPQTVIVTDRDLPWNTIYPWLEPLLRRAWQVDLVSAPK